jgi:hypothetical protein
MQFTPRRTIGGRAWTSISLTSEDQEKALVLWGNTSLGLLVHWWIANRQQSGRGNITPNVLEILPVLDVTALTADQSHKSRHAVLRNVPRNFFADPRNRQRPGSQATG